MQKKIWRFLTSLKLAIWLIAIIAVLCVIATLVPQGGEPIFYTEKYGGVFGTIILALAFDKMFSSALFIIVGLFFAVNLSCCTWTRVRWAAAMSKTKFKLAPWGSPLLHVGLCVVYVGIGVSLMLGREGFYDGKVGDILSVAEGREPFTLEILDISVEYYPGTTTPMQYTTQMKLTSESGVTTEDFSAVNRRAKFMGSGILQSNYSWYTEMLVGEGENSRTMFLPDVTWQTLFRTETTELRIGADLMPDFAEDPQRGPYSKSEIPNNPKAVTMMAEGNNNLDMKILAPGETATLAGMVPVTFVDYGYITGLHIKYDPGVPLIFAGFVLTCLGLMIRFLFVEKEKDDAVG